MAVIVGAGPAGASAAIALAGAGRPALMLERSQRTADAICGGFLSWRTVERLDRLGVDLHALGAPVIERLDLFAGRHRSSTPLVDHGRAVSRRTLDRALTDRAQALGAELQRGVHVRRVDGGGVETGDGARLGRGEPLILATGKHEVRGVRRGEAGGDPTLGVRWRFRLSPRVASLVEGAIELHLFSGGYAGLVAQEDGTANLCAAVRRSAFIAAGQSPEALLARLAEREPAIAERVDGAELVGSDAIANVPYGWIAQPLDGAYRVGDQAAVIPSLAGEGLGIAVASGELAARAIIAGEPPAVFQQRVARAARRPVRAAGLLWRLAEQRPAASLMPLLARQVPALATLAMRSTRFDDPAAGGR